MRSNNEGSGLLDRVAAGYQKPVAKAGALLLLGGRMKGDKGGRPSKQDLAMTGSMTKREQSAALKEFRQRMLLNPQSPKLIEKLFSLAFDDEAKNQSVALKILSDRILPVAGFTQDGKANSAVQINISGLGPDSGGGVTIDSVPVVGGDREEEED